MPAVGAHLTYTGYAESLEVDSTEKWMGKKRQWKRDRIRVKQDWKAKSHRNKDERSVKERAKE